MSDLQGNETYLLLTGISANARVRLGPHIELLPAICQLSPDKLSEIVENDFDHAIAVLVAPLIRSQLHITAANPEQLAVLAWNAQWDCLLLGALFDRDVLWNLQSDASADKIAPGTSLKITNRHLSGVNDGRVQQLTRDDETWLATHFETARTLLEKNAFQTAVHSLASYHWHPHPRTQLALIWSGIEALFGIDSELAFRISLYTARFLAPSDGSERSTVFASVKQLYKLRSKAVHGSDMKGDLQRAVEESADLLRRLVRRCIENNQLPPVEALAP